MCECIDARTDGYVRGCMGGWTQGWIHWMDGCIAGCKDVWVDAWMHREVDAWMDGWVDKGGHFLAEFSEECHMLSCYQCTISKQRQVQPLPTCPTASCNLPFSSIESGHPGLPSLGPLRRLPPWADRLFFVIVAHLAPCIQMSPHVSGH